MLYSNRKSEGRMLARPGQTIEQHTHECIVGASLNAAKIGLARTGAILGEFHDFGSGVTPSMSIWRLLPPGKTMSNEAPSITPRQEPSICGVTSWVVIR